MLMFKCALIVLVIISANTASGIQSDDHNVPKPASRIRDERESVWVEFIQLALDYKPLNLGQGFPDFAAPKYLVDSLHNATRLLANNDKDYLRNILNHQYTRSFGHPRLVKALQKYYKDFRGFEEIHDEKSQILVTVGAYEALFVSLMAFVQVGDQVILIDPAFDAYAPIVTMAGGKNVYVPLRRQIWLDAHNLTTEHFKLDMSELEDKMRQNKTSVLVLNTPNNPLDEVYEQFYYDSSEHVSIASLPGMWQRTITIGSAGKTFSVTGWKIGWAFGPQHLLRYAQLVHQTAVYTVATPLQESLALAFEHEMDNLSNGVYQQYWKELRKDLLKKRNRMARVLETAKLKPIVPQGGYFMLADFSLLAKLFPQYKQDGLSSNNGTSNSNDYKFARWLSRVKHLQGIPGSAFYSVENKRLAEDLIRFCFIKSEKTLDKFEDLIKKLIEGN